MNQTEIGKFIAQCRKEKKLTQAQLAEKLGITDRAVSKWETGKGMPDSSLLLELSEILGITVNELLSGARISEEAYEKKADENLIALKKTDESNRTRNVLISILYSTALLVGMIVCFICDLAISGSLTWSRIPAGSLVFAWLITIPGMLLGKQGIAASLLSLSVFLLPYLYILSRMLEVGAVFSIGAVLAILSLAFLWLLYAVFLRMGRKKRAAAFGLAFLSAIPFTFLINLALSKLIGEPFFDVWDMMSISFLLLFAIGSFLWQKLRK
ncbi:MAG: helix-turn-helix transcriptional regulator [Lachnospiraceae bacterium]|nr:helix-turn-helix transcriptional regulator [Lachnospiraceae bacterium]